MDKETFENYVLPIAIFLAAIVAWEAIVRFDDIQPYVLPAPSAIAYALYEDWGTLFHSLMVTLSITFEALFTAIVGGVVLALAFHLWRPLERAFFPFAVVMQVTPIIAIAPCFWSISRRAPRSWSARSWWRSFRFSRTRRWGWRRRTTI